jgi:hypothetical protein
VVLSGTTGVLQGYSRCNVGELQSYYEVLEEYYGASNGTYRVLEGYLGYLGGMGTLGVL